MNLEELDISENHININDLRNLPILRSLKIRSSMIEQIPLEESNPSIFSSLQTLDLAFNKLSHTQITHLFNIPLLRFQI